MIQIILSHRELNGPSNDIEEVHLSVDVVVIESFYLTLPL